MVFIDKKIQLKKTKKKIYISILPKKSILNFKSKKKHFSVSVKKGLKKK